MLYIYIYIWFLLRRVLIIEFKKTWKRVGALVFQIFNLIRIWVERCRLGPPGFGVQRTHPGFSKVVSRLAVVLVDTQLSTTPLVDYIRYHRILETRDFVVHGNFDWPRFSVTRVRNYLYMYICVCICTTKTIRIIIIHSLIGRVIRKSRGLEP